MNPFGFKGIGLHSLKEGTQNDPQSKTWNILNESVSFPAAVIDMQIVEHNISWMEQFLQTFATKISLAPHGKTTMMPNLFQKLCENKETTWGITLATPTQVQVAHESGISKVILANQLVGKGNMDIISEIFENDPEFQCICLVDSAENVEQLGKHFESRGQQIKVLLEYGPFGGRTGVRDDAQASSVLSMIDNWSPTVQLVGVEFYEGILKSEDSIRTFIQQVLEKTKTLIQQEKFQTIVPIITGAGSAWFDIVAEEFAKFYQANPAIPCEFIVRPGCYLIHDIGLYTEATSRIRAKALVPDVLKPALKIWAYVQSIPEPKLAILAFGKRDAAIDCGFPKPKLHFRPGVFKIPKEIDEEVCTWKILNMMDQHTFMEIADGDDIRIGDLLAFDIAHPCTTIDKWRNVLVIREESGFEVVDVLHTYF